MLATQYMNTVPASSPPQAMAQAPAFPSVTEPLRDYSTVSRQIQNLSTTSYMGESIYRGSPPSVYPGHNQSAALYPRDAAGARANGVSSNLLAAHSSQGSMHWHQKPDFVNMLSTKFNNDIDDGGRDLTEAEIQQANEPSKPTDPLEKNSSKDKDCSEDNECSDIELLQSTARGRHQA